MQDPDHARVSDLTRTDRPRPVEQLPPIGRLRRPSSTGAAPVRRPASPHGGARSGREQVRHGDGDLRRRPGRRRRGRCDPAATVSGAPPERRRSPAARPRPPPGRRCPGPRRPGRHPGSGTAWRTRRPPRSAREAPTTARSRRRRPAPSRPAARPAGASAGRSGPSPTISSRTSGTAAHDRRQRPDQAVLTLAGGPAGTRDSSTRVVAEPVPRRGRSPGAGGSGRKVVDVDAGRQVLQGRHRSEGGRDPAPGVLADEGDDVVGARRSGAARRAAAGQPSTSRPRDRACWPRSGARRPPAARGVSRPSGAAAPNQTAWIRWSRTSSAARRRTAGSGSIQPPGCAEDRERLRAHRIPRHPARTARTRPDRPAAAARRETARRTGFRRPGAESRW